MRIRDNRRSSAFIFQWGVDELTPDLAQDPGALQKAINFELLPLGGLQRIGGCAPFAGIHFPESLDNLQIVGMPVGSESNFTYNQLWSQATDAAEGFIPRSANYLGHAVVNTLVYVAFTGSTRPFEVGSVTASGVAGKTISFTFTADEIVEIAQSALLTSIVTNHSAGTPKPSTGQVRLVTSIGSDIYVVAENPATNDSRLYLASGGVWTEKATFPANGVSWEAYSHSFAGAAVSEKLYFVNGAMRCQQYDPDTEQLTEITTNLDAGDDKPRHVIAHRQHLFLGYSNGGIQHSDLGDPTTFQASGGAAEIQVGDDVTGFIRLPGNTLGILCRNQINLLGGTSTANWNLATFTDHVGAREGTGQSLPVGMWVDDRGITTLAQTQAFGDFQSGLISNGFNKILRRVMTPSSILMSAINRKKSQYRLFNQQGNGLYVTFDGNRFKGATEIDFSRLGANINTIHTADDANGIEHTYMGLSDGRVIELDVGPTLDNQPIRSEIKSTWWHAKSPEMLKHWRRVRFTFRGKPTSITGTPDYGHAQPNVPDHPEAELQFDYSPASGGYVSGELNLGAQSERMCVELVSDTSIDIPWVLEDATLVFSPRRMKH